MNNRIKEIRQSFNLSQAEFGARIGVTKATISRIESGSSNVTAHMVLTICHEFNVSKDWLENGTGSMFAEMSRAEMAANIVGGAIADGDEFVLNTFIALGQLTPAQWSLVKAFVNRIANGDV